MNRSYERAAAVFGQRSDHSDDAGLQQDSKAGGTSFNPRPYFRTCIGLMSELLPSSAKGDDHSDDALFAILNAFAEAFFDMQPLKVAGFAYCWLDLISHRRVQT